MKAPTFKLKFTAAFVLSTLSHAHASIVRGDVDYQYFRDFAENKGKFTVGASNIDVFNHDGQKVGTMFAELPMLDFAPISRGNGVATLASDQHLSGVEHNSGYADVSFGGAGEHADAHHFNYKITHRHDYRVDSDTALPQTEEMKQQKRNYYQDYHAPRLHKLVTETAAAAMPDDMTSSQFFDTNKYVSFARAGSGLQKVRRNGETVDVASAYVYLTGGVTMPIYQRTPDAINFGKNLSQDQYGPLVNFAQRGDSGSGVFGYNAQTKRWEFVGTITSITSETNNYLLNRPGYIRNIENKNSVALNADGKAWVWAKEGVNSSSIGDGTSSVTVNVFDPNLTNPRDARPADPALDHGKTVRINGTGSITLDENINQGAGALYFNDNFTVKAADDSVTWQGAGVSVADGKNVEWKVKNPENDRLSKIGKGTLTVSGNGTNTGDISVGDGTVVLNQTNGTAFKRVGIVSGRPTVVLGAANQIDPNELYFGFRGGRLDMNGQDIDFNRLQNVDEGAQIVNHNATQSANVTIRNNRHFDISQVTMGDRVRVGLDLYLWNKGGKEKIYLLPKNPKTTASQHPPYTDTHLWENLGKDLDAAKAVALERKNAAIKHSAFNGVLGETDANRHNGVLNVHYQAPSSENLLMLSGGAKLNGNLTASNGTLLLSGRPTPHAYDFVGKKDVIFEEKYAADWINRTFNAGNIIADNNATVHVGRNVSQVNANFTANDRSTLNLGVMNGTPVCIRSDYNGATKCDSQPLSAKAAESSPVVAINGNVQLDSRSRLNLGKAHLSGAVNGNGAVSLQADSRWTLTDSSQTGDLSLVEGAQITLGGNASTQNTLTIDGNLSGNGKFDLFSDIGTGRTDKIVVNGTASGTHTLNVQHSGGEPVKGKLELLTIKGSDQESQSLNVSLANRFVDWGTFRYGLFKRGNSFWLDLAQRNGAGVVSEDTPEGSVPERGINGRGLTAEDAPSVVFQNGRGVTTEDAPSVMFENGRGVTATDMPSIVFKNGEGVTAADEPSIEFRNGRGVTAADEPSIEFRYGVGVTAEDMPSIVFKNGAGVTAEDAPSIEFRNGAGVTAADEPSIEFRNGAGVTAQDEPSIEFRNGTGVTAEDAPSVAFANGKGVTTEDAPSVDFRNGNGATSSPRTLSDKELEITFAREFAMKNLTNEDAPEANLADIQAAYPHQKDYLSHYSNAAISELSAQGNVLLNIGARLDREIAHVDEQGVRVWAETGKQSGKFNDNLYRPYSQDITLTQIGVENVNGETTLGGVLSRSAADNQFDDAIKGKNTLHQLDLYAKQRFSHGVFAALDAGFGKAESKVGDAEFSRSVVSVGATIGARWQAESGLYLAPSLGARHYRLGGSRYVFDGAVVAIKPLHLTSYQAGVSIGKRFDFGSFSITPEFASYAQAVKSAEKTVSVNGNALSHQFGSRFKHELSVGVQKGGLSVGLSAGVQQGSQSQKQRFGAVKIGYNW